MRTTNFLTIASARPVNKDASRARDMKGEHHEVRIPPDLAHFKAPPPQQMAWRPGLTENLTGKQIGNLRVVRFHGVTRAKRPTWLVRCVCGDYELRRHESLSKSTDPEDACFVCKYGKRLREAAAAPNTSEARTAAAGRLDLLSEGLASGILGAYRVCEDPKNRAKYNVCDPTGELVFEPGVWDRWVCEQACAAINFNRGFGSEEED